MQCSEFEIRLCEYLDGALDKSGRREFEEHAAVCELCAPMLADARSLGRFLESVEEVEAPPELVTGILYRTRQARSAAWLRVGGWRGRFQRLLQPRYAMSMAMTILSVSMLYRVAGVQIRQLDVTDLNPIQIWQSVDNSTHRLWNRGVKFYQSVRFVYEIVEQWRAVRAEEDQARESEEAAPTAVSEQQRQQPAEPRRVEPSPRPQKRK